MITQPVSQINPYKVQVLSITPVNAGNVKARASVRVSMALLTGANTHVNEYQDLHGVKVVQQDRQRPWVAMPDAPWEDRHFQLFQPQPNGYQKEAITNAVLAAWNALNPGVR